MALGNNDEDLLWRASIEDNTKQFFDDFDKRIGALSDTSSKGFDDVGKSADNVGVQIGVLAGIFGAITSKVIDFGIQAVDALLSILQQSVAVTDEIDDMTKAFSVVGQNLGYNTKSLDGYVESLVAMDGITRKLALETLSKLAMNEIDLTRITDIARVAQDAAAASNMTVAQSFTMITNAIERQSPFMLKRLGLSVDMTTAYRREAEQLGIEVDQLSKAQKQQALMNEILEAGKVVNGAYAASANGLTQEQERQAKVMEEIQLELGNILLPAQLATMKEYRALLEEVMNYLKAHHDDLVTAGTDLAHIIEVLMTVADDLLELLGKIGGSVGDLIDGFDHLLVAIISALSGNTENAQYNSGLLNRLKDINYQINVAIQAFVMWKATAASFFTVVEGGFERFVALGELFNAALSGNAEKLAAAKDRLQELLLMTTEDKDKAMRDAYNKSVAESLEKMPWLTQGYDENAEAADQAAKSAENYADILQNKLDAAIEDATAKLKKLKEAQELQAADLARQAQRQAIEQEMRDQWAEEDRTRQHEEGIQNILEGAQEAKTNLAKKASENRLQIEKDYSKRLQAIHDQFDFDSEELIRKRDAIGLLALIRQNKRQLEKEKDAQEERRKTAQENYDKTLKELDDNTQKQLKKYEEAYAKQLENVQRNLDRQKQLKQLHDKWAQEDRDRQLHKQLEDIIKGFMAMDGATKQGLTQLLKDWGWYYTGLNEIINQYNAGLTRTIYPTNYDDPTLMKEMERRYNIDINGDGVIGQAGQVSSLLTPTMLNGDGVSRLSAVPANVSRGASDTRNWHITIDGNALEPQIQRVLVRSLLEIERNAKR